MAFSGQIVVPSYSVSISDLKYVIHALAKSIGNQKPHVSPGGGVTGESGGGGGCSHGETESDSGCDKIGG